MKNVRLVRMVYFSPTQTTKRVLEGIVAGIHPDSVADLDLTPPEARASAFVELHDELAVVGAPVYSGRIPIDAASRLRRVKGNGTPAVVVVVYGNRAYEDALLELRDLAIEAGFKPLAGGAFVGEHSFSSEAAPIACGRPDTRDLESAAAFGEMIRDKMAGGRIGELQVPGSFPYRERGELPAGSPVTEAALCTRCGTCAAVCPTAAVTVGDAVVTEQDTCILCCACIKSCPTGARAMRDPTIQRVTRWLSTNCAERREPELYL